jgi:ABC-type bacteriocin/lantibiotic exporter with double-glycine peptidase domain
MNFGQNIHNINHLENNEFIDNNNNKVPDKISLKLSAFSILYSFLKKHWKMLTIYLIVTLTSYPLESVVLPQMYSHFFDTIKKDQRTKTFIKYFFILTTILLITYSSSALQHYYEAQLLPEINAYYIDFIYSNLIKKYKNQYSDLDMGTILGKMTSIPMNIREITSDMCSWILPRILSILVINIYFFFVHWKLGLVSLILIIVFVIINMNIFNKCVYYSVERQITVDSKNSETNDKLNNLYSIYSSGDIQHEIESYQSNTLKLKKKYINSLKCINHNKIINMVFLIVLFIIINAYITFLYKTGEISYTMLVALFITVIYYIPCFYNISESIPDITHYLGVLNNYDSFLSDLQKVEKDDNNDTRPDIQISKGYIQINKLYFDYNGTRPLFKNINLNINGGDHIAFVGESGNGKSTLIKLIMGYYHVGDNMIFIDNQDINKINIESLRKEISFVNQNSKLFNTSIYDNISYGNGLSHDEIDNMIQKIGVGRIFIGLRDGLNSNAGVNGDQLSGGQKQMVHILRAMGKKNKIVIMDEPTGAIDVNNRELVIKAIKEMSKGKTLLLITHDKALFKACNRVVRISNGKIVSDKTY